MIEPAPTRSPGRTVPDAPVRVESPRPGEAGALLEQLAAVEARIRADRHRLPSAALEEIARLRAAGASIAGTAAGAGVSEHIVRDRLHRAGALGYPGRERHRHVREVLEARGPRLIAGYEKGRAIAALAADSRVSFQTIRTYLVSRGVELRTNRRRVPPALTVRGPELIAAYEGGASIKGLAADAGVSSSTVRRLLIAAGVALRHDRGRPRKRTNPDR